MLGFARTYVWAYTYVCVAPHVRMCKAMHTYVFFGVS